MQKIIFLPNAVRNLEKLREFLEARNRSAAARAARIILAAASTLKTHPYLGLPCENLPDYRDLIVPFGSSGYVIRYRIDGETISIVAVKHGKEAGFPEVPPNV